LRQPRAGRPGRPRRRRRGADRQVPPGLPDRPGARGPGGTVTAAGRPARDGLSIGAVLAQLRAEFPDVTISKIRFLESEGLVTPARTDSGYRQFSAADVERLRFVLTAQRDHYLPLKVIKDQLDGKLAPSNGLKLPRVLVPVRPQIEVDDEQPRRLTQEQLLEEGG